MIRYYNSDRNTRCPIREFLIKKGANTESGARNLKRIIDGEISDIISGEILFGKLKNGGTVKISTENEKLTFEFN